MTEATPQLTPLGTESAALPDRAHRRRWATLAVLSLSLVLIGMDTTVLNTAIPTMQRELGASASELQWIIDAYTLAFAGLLLTAGAWGDKYGRKLALAAGIVVFAAASTGTLLGDLTEVYGDLLRLAGGDGGRAFFRLAATEAGRDPRVGELYRISLAKRLADVSAVFDRAIERGELPSDVDRQLMFDWPAGVIVMRVLTGVPLPGPDEAGALAHATVYGFGARS